MLSLEEKGDAEEEREGAAHHLPLSLVLPHIEELLLAAHNIRGVGEPVLGALRADNLLAEMGLLVLGLKLDVGAALGGGSEVKDGAAGEHFFVA